VHTVRGTTGHVSDIAEANTLLHCKETVAYGDAGYQSVKKRPDTNEDVTWHAGKRKALNKENQADALTDQRNSRQAFGPRWSTRFWWSNASSAI
jgi:IS5 family transposase